VQARPVVYYYETCSEDRFNRVPSENDDGETEVPDPCRVERGQAGEIIALGNPALWWSFLAATSLLIAGVLRRDRRSSLPLVFYLVQFLPWLIVSRPAFSFYTVPFIPFLALGVGAAAAHLLDRRPSGWVWGTASVGAIVGLGGVFLADLLVGDYTRPTYGIGIGLCWVAGAATGDWIGRRQVDLHLRTGGLGRWAVAVVATAAVLLAIFFLPVWLGIPMDEHVVRQRWWFRGWI
jgi:dolichyl-phosphate-mannose--protein O-mannosyl transferase